VFATGAGDLVAEGRGQGVGEGGGRGVTDSIIEEERPEESLSWEVCV